MTIVAQTELDAVNHIIGSIGTAPITSLAGTLGVDAAMAQKALHRQVRRLCARGWYFNTEHEYPLTSDGSGDIALAPNIISVDFDTWRYPTVRVVKRGSALYDIKNHTFTFGLSKSYKATVKLLLQYDDLPEAARLYTMFRAGQSFQSDVVGDDLLYRFDEKDVQEAWVDLLTDDADVADESIFGDNYISSQPVTVLNRHSRG